MEKNKAAALCEQRYEELLTRLQANMPAVDAARLRAAYEFAARAHEGQLRKDGSPYVTHPVEVAHIVVDLALDLDSVIAALLHDTIEDTGFEYADIKSNFGATVANLVDGVTKLTRVPYTSKEDQQMENLRKMFLAMARDIRVILIKICDRLHNMRTLEYHNAQKRREKSLETMEIYAPLAHRLGMQKMKWELEDLALFNLDPVGYKEIMSELATRSAVHESFLAHVQERLADRLVESGIKAHIEGRIKHIYSIYRKMYNMHKSLFEIYDLYAVRVIVDELADCYNVLGFVHDLYKPMPGRFKDYISTPKPNMYQSLHTTVIGREGLPFEVQIRTWEMHHTAEYGIAAHWKYKQGVEGQLGMEQKLEWVRRLLEAQQDTDAEDFIRSLKIDMFADEVFVFTPRGDVINLPAKATPVDFAYAIHSAVGNRMMGAKVNGRIVSIDYNLQNGDIIEILTGNTHGPSRDWLKLAKTNEARNKIRQWFKKERREENIAQGREEFDRELKRAGIPMTTLAAEDTQAAVLKRLSFGSMEELYAAVGYGGITAIRAVNRIRDELVRINRLQMQTDKETVERFVRDVKKARKAISGVIVEGIDNCLIKFARCCAPVPGDDIVGFITRGYGVSVHKASCENAVKGQTASDASGRWVRVTWSEEIKDLYQAGLHVTARDRDGLFLDIATALSNLKVSARQISGRSQGDDQAAVCLTVEVRDNQQLLDVITRLGRVEGVIEVARSAIQ
ncbi:MAG: bifunctional (p)ppGpp synthetase/guanosine-3',5'-bis(diphosphate) 3'-pyrophosphohydrolase [Oscillospiraceae bacterium]|jgi:GTP pyrophosphokinase|nr:bifunctional (p)ppGpp synthetase/guanosine-3',5'-bis(diphosphate) 3'-pyrophosphohydrolase [Oscillospiraceae bacterium]